MRSVLVSAVLCLTAAGVQAADVGVTIGINQPGVYGRINIGNVPQPALWVSQPILIAPPRVVVQQQPVYMYVPPGHQRNWAKHCASYGACAQPVYFVRESWVREQHAHQNRGKGHDKHHGDGHGKGDKGHGKGKGHGKHDG